MHLTSCLSVLKQAGKHDMIKCRLWLRCCNKIISSYSRQTMEALTSMWTHATNKGSPLDVMMVRFYIFKHFMDLYLSIVLNCWNYKSESFSSLIELEGLECLKIKTSILTSQDLALRPQQILPLENAMRVSAPQVKMNSIFNLLTQDLIITITQASVFQAALPVTRLMIVTGILIFLSLLLGQMIISFPPLSYHQ